MLPGPHHCPGRWAHGSDSAWRRRAVAVSLPGGNRPAPKAPALQDVLKALSLPRLRGWGPSKRGTKEGIMSQLNPGMVRYSADVLDMLVNCLSSCINFQLDRLRADGFGGISFQVNLHWRSLRPLRWPSFGALRFCDSCRHTASGVGRGHCLLEMCAKQGLSLPRMSRLSTSLALPWALFGGGSGSASVLAAAACRAEPSSTGNCPAQAIAEGMACARASPSPSITEKQ